MFEEKDAVRDLGAIECMIPLLASPNPSLQMTITTCLLNCSFSSQNQVLVRKLGGLELFLKITAPNYETQVRVNSLVALSNYTVNGKSQVTSLNVSDDNKEAIGALNGIQLLLEIISHPSNDMVKEKAAGILWNCSKMSNLLLSSIAHNN